MKRYHWAALALIFALIACNLPGTVTTAEPAPPTDAPTEEAPADSTDVPAEPTDIPAEPPAEEATAVPSVTPAPTEAIEGGFTTDELDTADLPALEITVTGGGPLLCGLGVEEDVAPFISEAIELAGSHALCFVNYPTENGTRLRVDVGNGEYSYFAEFYVQNGIVYGPGNEPRGEITEDGVPSWLMWVHIPAWLPQQGWVVESALSEGGSEASLTLDREEFGFVTIGPADDRPDNPLLFPYDISDIETAQNDAALRFTPGEQTSIAGAAYAPNATLTVALYAADPDTRALTPHAATTLSTDANGQWETAYTFDAEADPGLYVVVVNPTAGETVSPFNGYMQLETGE